MLALLNLARRLLCPEQWVPTCRVHVFVVTCLVVSIIDLTKEVLWHGHGMGLQRSWFTFLMLTALVESTQHLSWYRQVVPLVGSKGLTPLSAVFAEMPNQRVDVATVAFFPTISRSWHERKLFGGRWQTVQAVASKYCKLLASGKPAKDVQDDELRGMCSQGMVINGAQLCLGFCMWHLSDSHVLLRTTFFAVQALIYYLSWQGHAAFQRLITCTEWSLMIESRFVESSCVMFVSNVYIACVEMLLYLGECVPTTTSTLNLSPLVLFKLGNHTRLSSDSDVLIRCSVAFIVPVAAQWFFVWRYMLGSGLCKVGGNGWRTRTALASTAHYVNQPLPSWTAWFTTLLPKFCTKMSVEAAFVIEVVCPFLVFGPVGVLLTVWIVFARHRTLMLPAQLNPRLNTLEGRFVDAFLTRSNTPYDSVDRSRLNDVAFAVLLVILNASCLPVWLNRLFRLVAGCAFLFLMLLINLTGNFGNLGAYTASVCALLWAPLKSAQSVGEVQFVEASFSPSVCLAFLASLPLLYVYVALSLEALNASIPKLGNWNTFPLLELMKQPSSRKRTALEDQATLLQELKRRRITASANKPFSSVSDRGRVELVFEVRGGRPDSHDGEHGTASQLPWRRVPFFFKPYDSGACLPWLFFFPGANYWPRFDWISFFWRQFGSSHAKEQSLKAFMQKLFVDDPVLDQLLPKSRPRAAPGKTFLDVRAVRCSAHFGEKPCCMEISSASEPRSTDVITLSRVEKQSAIEASQRAGRGTASSCQHGFFSYAAGCEAIGNVTSVVVNMCFVAFVVCLLW